jgi:hypothetical protein
VLGCRPTGSFLSTFHRVDITTNSRMYHLSITMHVEIAAVAWCTCRDGGGQTWERPGVYLIGIGGQPLEIGHDKKAWHQLVRTPTWINTPHLMTTSVNGEAQMHRRERVETRPRRGETV